VRVDGADGHVEEAALFTDGREPDVECLPLFCDALPPAVFASMVTGWVPTLELTVHVRAVPRPGWVKALATSRVILDGLLEDHVQPRLEQLRRIMNELDARPILADIEGRDRNDLIVATSDGWIHAYRADGSEAPGWPVHTDPLPLHADEQAFRQVGTGHYNAILGGLAAGDLFGSGQMQLPFVLQSAETMKAAVAYLGRKMERVEGQEKGTIVLATVKGDVHDIGKNLVDIILTNNGYRVVNLGIKVPLADMLSAARENRAHAIGMSGLLVKSTVVMRENLEEMSRQGLSVPVMLGGAALIRWLEMHAVQLQGILLTHSHPDHAPGAALLAQRLNAPVWASPHSAAGTWSVTFDHAYTSGMSFSVDGDTLHVLPTPGHTNDHVALWLSGARILFSGDTILGPGTTLVAPPEGNMQQYMQTLYMLRDLDARCIAPGHGPLVHDPRAKIDKYIVHRSRREEEILEVLATGPAGIEDLLHRVYAGIDPRLHDFARGSIAGQLQKLEVEGKVVARDGRYAVSGEPASTA